LPKYKVVFSEEAKKDFLKLEKSIAKIIINKIALLEANPDLGQPLHSELKGLFKLKVSKYRVVYKIEDGQLIVLILGVATRKDELIYSLIKKRLAKLI